MSQIQIRPAREDDVPQILTFIKELADYEKALHEVLTSEQDLHDTLFCANPKVYALCCSIDGKPAGIAIYFFSYSTWVGKHGLFLEDLYISMEFRGSGAGKALLKHLAQLALDNNCGRFEWNVLDWNEPAIAFYESFGAQAQNEWIGYRLSGDALSKFAQS